MNDQNLYNNNQSNSNNMYQAPSAPQPSTSTFDYNQLYGNSSQKVEDTRDKVVFDEPLINSTTDINNQNQQIKISNDELIPEFDASVLEVLPSNVNVNYEEEKKSVTVSTMAIGKKAENEQNKRNVIFIILLFGIIAAVIYFVFPMLLNV